MIALLLLMAAQSDVEGIARAHAGAWASGGFEFETLTPTGEREVDGETLFSVGGDAGFCVRDTFLVLGGAEWSFAGDVEVVTAHLSAGWRLRVREFTPQVPDFRFELTAGVLWGELEVDESGFGDFEHGLGVRAGADVLFDLGKRFALGGYVEARFIRFEYDEEVLDGDEHAGGGGVAAGVMAELRF